MVIRIWIRDFLTEFFSTVGHHHRTPHWRVIFNEFNLQARLTTTSGCKLYVSTEHVCALRVLLSMMLTRPQVPRPHPSRPRLMPRPVSSTPRPRPCSPKARPRPRPQLDQDNNFNVKHTSPYVSINVSFYYDPPLIGGGIKRCFYLTSVCRIHRV